MTLYLKYRPKNLDELDEISVSDSLKKIVSQKSIPHAFLFAGPKGTGKTSAARILAKILNCEDLKDGKPCDKCKECVSISNGNNLDVIEMDAASHRGIDDVRILRDAVKLSPVSAKNKIYIIDEVHMLTTEAENALLKTLEEPPENVYFILATTNPEKLIDTIKSRATLIQFRKASSEEIVVSLKRAADGEKVKISEEGLNLIAEAADGAFRDAIKILEQVLAEGIELTPESLSEFLFKNKSYDLDKFMSCLVKRDLKNLLEDVEGLGKKGVNIESFTESLIKKLRIILLSKVGVGEETTDIFSKDDLIKLIGLFSKALTEMNDSPVEELPLELALMEWCGDQNSVHGTRNTDKDDKEEKEEKIDETPPKESATVPTPLNNLSPVAEFDSAAPVEETDNNGKDIAVDDSAWKNILSLVKPINASMEALLRAAKPIAYNGKTLTLGVYYKFHKERIEEAKHRKILEDVIGKVFQSATKVCCVLVEPPPKKVVEESKTESILTEGKDKDIIKVAQEIFGN